MLAHSRHHTRARRGIVLVLVLAMLGLLALIGVTFATYSGQAKINARIFAQSVVGMQGDELMDFALSQLINDTGDVRSVIRGHSLARDMYGNDAFNNGYLTTRPDGAAAPPHNNALFYITNAKPAVAGRPTTNQANTTTNPHLLWDLKTNIPAPNSPNSNPPYDSTFYGYDFTHWIIQVSYTGPFGAGSGRAVTQTFEIICDDWQPGATNTQFSGQGYHAFKVSPRDNPTESSTKVSSTFTPPDDLNPASLPQTVLHNPTQGITTQMAWEQYWAAASNGNTATINYPFILDGRWLRAFNGPGMRSSFSTATGVSNSVYGNFRYTAGLNPNWTNPPYSPDTVGMDEDYDACDLENWFLAIQSADGQVVIPSFHRPAIIRYDPNGAAGTKINDWSLPFRFPNGRTNPPNLDSLARILRPVGADGHDRVTFPDLIPDAITGKITFDVDNDGDGITDSVWLDLGYPARRDSRGQLYKPLFAFLVIGLNGRIPLNTAGNLASNSATGPDHALHLGNSVSEVDPTYALQNAFQGDFDPFNTGIGSLGFTWPPNGTFNTQVDNSRAAVAAAGGIDVRLTQLRNLLAGTRPQTNPTSPTAAGYPPNTDPTGRINGDDNSVYGSWPGVGAQQPYFMPNGLADNADILINATPPQVQRTTASVAGRWGEAQSVPGLPLTVPGNTNVFNWLSPNYHNPIRAGYSFDLTDFITSILASNGAAPVARDAADDNFNLFDPFPYGHAGELNDQDSYDLSGGLILPIDRMRRFVTPVDINGTGSVSPWPSTNLSSGGGDQYGRVLFSSYFRPPGGPGVIATNYLHAGLANNIVANNGVALGAISYPYPQGGTPPQPSPPNPDFYTSGPNPTAIASANYLPDQTNNPLHGFESYKLPYVTQLNPQNPQGPPLNVLPGTDGGMQVDVNANTTYGTPTTYPTYNTSIRNEGLNEADEMNLYTLNPLLDSPFGPSDLEWLYRQQDVDGATLTSRLARLAPISFTNTIDGQRRRRLVALDSWEMNNLTWTNDNPGTHAAPFGAFSNNSRFYSANLSPTLANPLPTLLRDPVSGVLINVTNADHTSLSAIQGSNTVYWTTPSLAQRDKKINLNFPLPVSNNPNEPVRQKWISDTYQLLKWTLPPRAVDTPEELAQLSQFVINIVDFRDSDSTMTHWVNPDVVLLPGAASLTPITGATPGSAPTLAFSANNPNPNGTSIHYLDQYGMEYNPIAINETLAFIYQYWNGTAPGTQANRFFIEFVNTLSQSALGAAGATPPDPSVLSLGGFNNATVNPNSGVPGATDPYAGGCWDLVFTEDWPSARPDPYRGDLTYNPGATTPYWFGLIPLTKDAFNTNYNFKGTGGKPPTPTDVTLSALTATGPPAATATTGTPTASTNYYYAIGNTAPSATNEFGTPGPQSNSTPQGATATPFPSLIQTFETHYDPTSAANPPFTVRPGVLPGIATPTTLPQTTTYPIYAAKLTQSSDFPKAGTQTAAYYWVCLRRPANLFAPVSVNNPMVVVDSMRFPFIDGTIPATHTPKKPPPAGGPKTVPDPDGDQGGIIKQLQTNSKFGNQLYSAQRFQPYRGGHAVLAPTTPTMTMDPRYGFSEQIVAPVDPGTAGSTASTYLQTQGIYYVDTQNNIKYYDANVVFHTLGQANEEGESWDYFPFHDRDFTSVAELLLVPGCPPGLFTKQFAEFAPTQPDPAAATPPGANFFTLVQPQTIPTWAATNPQGKPPGQGTPALRLPTITPPPKTNPNLVTWANPNYAFFSMPFEDGATLTPPVVNVPAIPAIPVHTFPYMVDKFFYTGASLAPATSGSAPAAGTDLYQQTVNSASSDGWFKMFDFFEVPSQMIGSIGPVAQGANFDWARQDTKPGLLNLNLIIDEEVFFSIAGKQTNNFNQTLLNFDQIPGLVANKAGGYYTLPLAGKTPVPVNNQTPTPLPLVVTGIDANGSPSYVYPVTNYGVTAVDPILAQIHKLNATTAPSVDARIKAAFAQFLWLRHGGSGYIFGFGTAATGQNFSILPNAPPPNHTTIPNYGIGIPAEIPFRSLSYPDIDYTVMRPAMLPPTGFTNQQANPAWWQATPPVPWYNASGTATAPTAPVYGSYVADPGVRNVFLYPGYTAAWKQATPTPPTGSTYYAAGGAATGYVFYPPTVPTRRLFQVPDAYSPANVPGAVTSSNASDAGDPNVNNLVPMVPNTVTNPTVNGGLPPYTTAAATYSFNNGYPTLVASGNVPGVTNDSLGGASAQTTLGTGANLKTYNQIDYSQHPYWRTELLQRVMNLTTVRTHQYAVWITVGFFEVTRQGDIGMLATGTPQLAFDILGAEIGAVSGKSIRFRGFFLVDRLRLNGFDPTNTGSFRSAVVYRKVIQ
jgi:hypothetical protein